MVQPQLRTTTGPTLEVESQTAGSRARYQRTPPERSSPITYRYSSEARHIALTCRPGVTNCGHQSRNQDREFSFDALSWLDGKTSRTRNAALDKEAHKRKRYSSTCNANCVLSSALSTGCGARVTSKAGSIGPSPLKSVRFSGRSTATKGACWPSHPASTRHCAPSERSLPTLRSSCSPTSEHGASTPARVRQASPDAIRRITAASRFAPARHRATPVPFRTKAPRRQGGDADADAGAGADADADGAAAE
mmetsp:Transcript_88797/g.287024  ORF Transcript_88797/g.287024 Transcript_88797/m.287024 type:complete len:250 (-) Transcript_88797:566-1315(-)